ncbi:MAG: DegV family protein [Clostridiales bacterium]|nr:DegV family protein [Clostridiales bacterium]
MTKDYIIFMDVSGDLDKEFAAKNDVKFVPMEYTMSGVTYTLTDMDDSGHADFYKKLRGNSSVTTQITPYTYEKLFEPYLEQGHSVLYLCLSSGLSSTFESACTAASNLKERHPNATLFPIDSLAATAGMGILAEMMVKNKQNGMSAEENKKSVEDARNTVYTSCFVEDLMHLKRGGRIGAVSAVFGSMLGIKPIIRITPNGKLENCDKPKGERKALAKLCEKYRELADMNSEYNVYVCHADNLEMARFFEEELKAINPNITISERGLSPIIGTHLGPGSVLISFKKK